MEDLRPEDILEILRKHGTKVTLEEARIILEFMTFWVKIVLSQYLEK